MRRSATKSLAKRHRSVRQCPDRNTARTLRNARSKELIVKAIRKRRREKKPLNAFHMLRYEQRLLSASVVYFGGWAQAIKAAGLDYLKIRKQKSSRSWSKKAIAAEIKCRVAKGLSIKSQDVSNQDRGLFDAAKKLFGRCSWSKARVFAGLEPREPHPTVTRSGKRTRIWTKQTVVAEIHRLHQIGAELNSASMLKNGRTNIRTAGRKRFGTWEKAVRAAGLNYSKIRKRRKSR